MGLACLLVIRCSQMYSVANQLLLYSKSPLMRLKKNCLVAIDSAIHARVYFR